MSKPLVIYTDCIYQDPEFEKEYFTSRGCEYRIANHCDEESLINEIQDADALLVSYTKMTETVINALNHCKVIVREGTGYDNVDTVAAAKRGIPVCNVKNYCSDEVAEHALSMALSLLRCIPWLDRNAHAGIWDPTASESISRISDLTLGIYGFGNIGKALAAKSTAIFGKVIAYGPTAKEEDFKKYGVIRVTSEEELLENADVLSLHIPMNQRNAGLMTYEKFCKMKKTAFFINTARGGLVNEADLIKALHEQQIAGAGIDVIASDHPDTDYPLFREENIILTPHTAYLSTQAMADLRRIAAEQVMEALEGKEPGNQVN